MKKFLLGAIFALVSSFALASQNDMSIGNQTFPSFRSDLNSALQALASNSKGNSRPSTVYAGQFWLDDNTPSSTMWSWYFYDGTHDVGIGLFDSTNGIFIPTVNPHADTVGGTADVITLDVAGGLLNPTAYYEGLLITFIAGGTNTGAVTVNVGGLGAKNVTKRGSVALAAGDIQSGMVSYIEYDGTRFQLINPALVPGQLIATATNDSAATGRVGEYVSSTVVSGSAVSLTTATPKTVTSISLTAGDWDVQGIGYFKGNAATTVTSLLTSLSSTTDTFDSTAGKYAIHVCASSTLFATNDPGLAIPSYRISLSSTTTIYLVSSATFGTNTLAAYGYISARRVR